METGFPETRGPPSRAALGWTAALIAVLTLMRVAVLFASPLELYPEEAQYWLWSRHLALGYFSKPPLIAWTIAATTAIGNGEAWVRLGAPLAQAMAGLALSRAGARLYGGWVGFWAAALYELAPGVQLSAAVIATDSLALAAAGLATWAYAVWLAAPASPARLRAAAGLGAALGLGALAKYAIVYVALGLVLHALVAPTARRRWRPGELALVVGLTLLLLAPNLAWNAAHGFQTLRHTAHDAAWRAATPGGAAHPPRTHADILAARQAPGFLLAQLATFGPVALIALGVGAVRLALRRQRAWPADVALLCLTAPALALMLVEAAIARANANWAAMAYAPASVLVAAWLLRWRARAWLATAAALGGAIQAALMAALVWPTAADGLGLANSFKRLRGWRELAALTARELRQTDAAGVSAIALDDRFSFNALAYYGRDSLAGTAPLRMWVREIAPRNEAETTRPLTPETARVLFVDVGGAYRREAMGDFARVRPLGSWRIRLDRDPRHDRPVFMFIGEDYVRRPRDPNTGLPEPP